MSVLLRLDVLLSDAMYKSINRSSQPRVLWRDGEPSDRRSVRGRIRAEYDWSRT